MALSPQENGSNNGAVEGGDVLTDLRNTMSVGYIHEAYKEWCIKNAEYVSRVGLTQNKREMGQIKIGSDIDSGTLSPRCANPEKSSPCV